MAHFGIMVSTILTAIAHLLCIRGTTALSTYSEQATAWLYWETAVSRGIVMPKLPKYFPESSKYVVEARGPLVRRYVELPDGRRIHLRYRKAKPCICAERSASSVRNKDITNSPTFDRRVFT